MLHLDVEIQSIHFFINSSFGQCSVQVNDSFTSKILESKIECKCEEVQYIYEKVEFDIPYNDDRYLKIIFYQGQACFGEAIINLGFYIENNLPMIIDNIPINNKYDQEAQIEVCLAWYQKDQAIINQIVSSKVKKTSGIYSQHIQQQGSMSSYRQVQTQLSTTENQEGHQQLLRQEQVRKKSQFTLNQKNEENNYNYFLEKIDNAQSPKKIQLEKKQLNPPVIVTISNINTVDKKKMIEENYQLSIHPNEDSDLRVQEKLNTELPRSSQVEVGEIMKGQTKPKVYSRKLAFDSEHYNSRPTQNEQGLMLSCRQLDDDLIENNSLKIQNQALQNQCTSLQLQFQKLNSEKELLRRQALKNETAYNLLTDTYFSLKQEYEKFSSSNRKDSQELIFKATENLEKKDDKFQFLIDSQYQEILTQQKEIQRLEFTIEQLESTVKRSQQEYPLGAKGTLQGYSQGAKDKIRFSPPLQHENIVQIIAQNPVNCKPYSYDQENKRSIENLINITDSQIIHDQSIEIANFKQQNQKLSKYF